MTAWNPLMRLYDRRVLHFMDDQRLELQIQREQNLLPEPIPVPLIAQRCHRNIQSTTRSLLRLEKRGKVYEAKRGAWLPGKRPQNIPPPGVPS